MNSGNPSDPVGSRLEDRLAAIAEDAEQLTAEKWYFRIDGREFGPSTRAELEYLLRPPRICRTLQVKCSEKHLDWQTIGHGATLDSVLTKFGIPIEPSPVPAAGPSRFSQFMDRILEGCDQVLSWVVSHAAAIAIVVVFAAASGIIWFITRDPQLHDREILVRYVALWESVKKFDPKAPSTEWRTFAQSAQGEIDPFVKELTRTASVGQPARQILLYLGRDNLPPILKAERPPTRNSREARLVDRHLLLVKQQLDAPNEKPSGLPRRM